MEIVSMQFFMALGSIILLDILLGGDNASSSPWRPITAG